MMRVMERGPESVVLEKMRPSNSVHWPDSSEISAIGEREKWKVYFDCCQTTKPTECASSVHLSNSKMPVGHGTMSVACYCDDGDEDFD